MMCPSMYSIFGVIDSFQLFSCSWGEAETPKCGFVHFETETDGFACERGQVPLHRLRNGITLECLWFQALDRLPLFIQRGHSYATLKVYPKLFAGNDERLRGQCRFTCRVERCETVLAPHRRADAAAGFDEWLHAMCAVVFAVEDPDFVAHIQRDAKLGKVGPQLRVIRVFDGVLPRLGACPMQSLISERQMTAPAPLVLPP